MTKTEFKIKYGGHFLEICCKYPYTYELCEHYLTAVNNTDKYIEAQPEEIQKIKDFIGKRNIRDDVAESEAIHHAIADYVLDKDELIIHAAVCAVENTGFGFIAPSGTGKTTHMLLWKELLKDKFRYVNGDKPLISLKNNIVYASGTPWCGKERYQSPETVRLKAMAFLRRSDENGIKKLTPYEAEKKLINAVVLSEDMANNIMPVVRLINRIAKAVDFCELSCNKEPRAAELAYSVMRGIE